MPRQAELPGMSMGGPPAVGSRDDGSCKKENAASGATRDSVAGKSEEVPPPTPQYKQDEKSARPSPVDRTTDSFFEGNTLSERFPLFEHAVPASIAMPNKPALVSPMLRADVICFSIIDWEFRYQRPQQVMSQFAAQGHRVFYIRISHFLEPGAAPRVSVRDVKRNIFEITLTAKDPFSIYKNVVEDENERELLSSLDELRRMFHIEYAIAYVMIASWINVALAARRRWGWNVLYDCMDEWKNFPGFDPVVLEAERNLVRESDLVVVSAERLYRKWQGAARSVILVRNAVDYDFYARELKPNTLLAGVKAPVIGYYGAIAEWFDVDLVAFVASHRPECTFVLLGGVFDVDVSSLQELSNVRLLGQQPYDLMPQYLYHFDACMIPFKINPITESTDPVKLYEYLSGGKPVVATALPELDLYRECIYQAEGKEDFLSKLDVALKEKDEDLVARRRSLAQENSWPDRYQSIYSALSEIVPRASIIVVSHNNLTFTKLCLESVLRNTEYPGYELVVVDDNSIDGTREYLQELSSVNPRVIPVFNSEQLGLVGATKQGLARGTGDFIVLLDTATFVPRGWLSRVMRHLREGGSTVVGASVECARGAAESDVRFPTWNEIEEFALNRSWACEGQTNEASKLPRICVSLTRKTLEAARSMNEDISIAEFERESFISLLKEQGIQVAEARDVFVYYSPPLVRSALWELVESREAVKDLTAKLDEQRRTLETLSSNLENSNRQLHQLQASAAETAQTMKSLGLQISEKDQANELLTTQLMAKAAELNQIRNSFGWRLLSRYGPIKYRYLLPLCRRLGLLSGEPAAKWTDAAVPVVQQSGTRVQPAKGVLAVSAKAGKGPALKGKDEVHRFVSSSVYDVLCFPIIDWDFRFQRPQQLLSQFAQDGHRVFYCRTQFHGSGRAAIVKNIASNIYNFRLPAPSYLNLYLDEIDFRTAEVFLSALDTLRLEAGITDALCLVQLPFWAPLALKARERWGWKIIYDCMDEHGGFSTNNADMLGHEESLIAHSDLVLATSHLLYKKSARLTPHVLFLPNAADFKHFNGPSPHRLLGDFPRPIIGYYGAISDWFDVDMVHGAARARPDWQFVLIGSTFGAKVSSLRRIPNVHLLGEQPYSSLPGYLQEFDVACIPFLITALTRATNPVKFYEYLSAGKPVVAVELPELKRHSEYFYPVRTAGDFVSQIELALKEQSPEKVRQRIEFARMNTWSHRYTQLSAAVRELYGKVAIIIVSYNNPEYLRMCLESLWAKTVYPNFEVIVVDNGSQPEVIQYLRVTADTEPRLKVIFNGENLGFARANNIGIAAAGECKYVVLLNDDTVVTRSWLGGMIHYLSEKGIGLVGPVTNWAGNEAKIEVPYRGLDGMDQFAEQYTREHAGQSFDIHVLAMYCLGMRKSLLDQVGVLDEQFGIGMFEDDDFALRVRQAGLRVVCAEDIFIHHWGRASFRRLDQAEYDRLFADNRGKFERKWGQVWEAHKYRKT